MFDPWRLKDFALVLAGRTNTSAKVKVEVVLECF